ncbi:MAG: hypothetical protein M1134_01930 [Actinobacteria bacterium]|nr:hypothetical protein [Actinomycetota bacterium]MCL5444688.1 hypothetical protein [Actinomycetota bacterium]
MKNRLRKKGAWWLAGAVLIVAAGGGAGAIALASSPPTTLALPVTVRDTSGQLALSVQLQQAVRDTGSFAFKVNSVGTWIGTVPVTSTPSGNSVLSGTASGVRFEAVGSNTAVPATLRMEGTIRPTEHFASVNVWVSPLGSATSCEPAHAASSSTGAGARGACHLVHYHLVTAHAVASGAPGAAQAALNAIKKGDWSGLYAMAANSVTSKISEPAFVQTFSAQNHGRIVSASFAGAGSTRSIAGYEYFTQPVSFALQSSSGTTSTYTSTIVLVWEKGQWRFTGTSTPQPAS